MLLFCLSHVDDLLSHKCLTDDQSCLSEGVQSFTKRSASIAVAAERFRRDEQAPKSLKYFQLVAKWRLPDERLACWRSAHLAPGVPSSSMMVEARSAVDYLASGV